MFETEEHHLPPGASSVALEHRLEPRTIIPSPPSPQPRVCRGGGAAAGAGAVRVGSRFF